jgi:hypothetical protein
MRRVLPSLGALGLWLLLCGFSDPKGVFTAAIDPHWQMVKDFGGLYAFAPDGDRSRGGLTIGTVPPQSLSLLGEAVATVGDAAHFMVETPYTIAGVPCLFTESRETTPGGVPTVTHNIFCYLRTTLDGMPKAVFVILSTSPSENLAEFDAVFWPVVRSVSWGPAVRPGHSPP